MTNDERNELLDGLRNYHGSLTEVAQRAGVTLEYVGRVLRGKRNSTKVLDIASQVYEECVTAEFEAEQQIKARLARVKSLSVAQ
jgi:transcriptional regulator with XRE-family HTH domain